MSNTHKAILKGILGKRLLTITEIDGFNVVTVIKGPDSIETKYVTAPDYSLAYLI